MLLFFFLKKYLLTLDHRLQFPNFPLNFIFSIKISSYRLSHRNYQYNSEFRGSLGRQIEIQIKQYKGIKNTFPFSFGRIGRITINGNAMMFFSLLFCFGPQLHPDLGVFPAQHFRDNSPHGLQDPCSLCFYSNSPVLLGQKQFSAAVVKAHFFIPFSSVALVTSLSLFWSLSGKFHPLFFFSLQ